MSLSENGASTVDYGWIRYLIGALVCLALGLFASGAGDPFLGAGLLVMSAVLFVGIPVRRIAGDVRQIKEKLHSDQGSPAG